MKCSRCGEENIEGAMFCSECGSRLELPQQGNNIENQPSILGGADSTEDNQALTVSTADRDEECQVLCDNKPDGVSLHQRCSTPQLSEGSKAGTGIIVGICIVIVALLIVGVAGLFITLVEKADSFQLSFPSFDFGNTYAGEKKPTEVPTSYDKWFQENESAIDGMKEYYYEMFEPKNGTSSDNGSASSETDSSVTLNDSESYKLSFLRIGKDDGYITFNAPYGYSLMGDNSESYLSFIEKSGHNPNYFSSSITNGTVEDLFENVTAFYGDNDYKIEKKEVDTTLGKMQVMAVDYNYSNGMKDYIGLINIEDDIIWKIELTSFVGSDSENMAIVTAVANSGTSAG